MLRSAPRLLALLLTATALTGCGAMDFSSTPRDKDAVVMDRATATYADYRKVRPIHFDGKYFKCRGPLNTVRSPQGKPVFVQAGGSPRGRAFAAKHADSIIAVANGNILANARYHFPAGDLFFTDHYGVGDFGNFGGADLLTN